MKQKLMHKAATAAKQILPVAAAASAPSSLTSMKALWTTLDTFKFLACSNKSVNSASFENILFMPI